MRAILLIVVGTLIFAAGIAGLVHPQWQGRDKQTSVDFGDKHYVVTTRRIVDIPKGFCISIIVLGGCTATLGVMLRSKPRNAA
jgi:hypothetical protein